MERSSEIFAFGENRSGQLGRGTGECNDEYSAVPVCVSLPPSSDVLRIAAAGDTSYAIVTLPAEDRPSRMEPSGPSQKVPPRTLRTRTPSMHPRAISASLRNLFVTDFLGICNSLSHLVENAPTDRSGVLDLCNSGLQVFRSAAALNASFHYTARRRVLAIRSVRGPDADGTVKSDKSDTHTSSPVRHARTISATAIRLHSFSQASPSTSA